MKVRYAAIALALLFVAVLVALPLSTADNAHRLGSQLAQIAQVGQAVDVAASASDAQMPASEGVSADQAGAAAASGADDQAYEQGALIVTLPAGATAESLLARLASVPELAGATLADHVTDTVVKLALPEGIAVERAASVVTQAAGAVAQPNYRYHLQENARPDPIATAAGAHAADLVAGTALGDALGIQADVTPNDTYYSRQWYLSSINAPAAWGSLASTSPVSVAVMDADFRATHPDLAANVAAAYSFGWHRSYDDMDHGTHTSGIIAAVANNGYGVAGVTFNTCQVCLMRVSDSWGEISTESIVRAYQWAQRNASRYNIRVVSMSLGSGSYQGISRSSDTAFYDAIESAREAGIITVAAACNNDDEFTAPFYAFPSDFDNVVSVINLKKASNGDGVARESSSNYNKGAQKAKNIAAPGTNIYSLYASGSGFGSMTGTSMATPVAAGVLGLILANDPQLSADEAVSKLYSTARDITNAPGTSAGWDRQTGFGEVDAAAAVADGVPYLSGDSVIRGSALLRVKIDGAAQPADEWTWTSSNPEIARPTATGRVYGYKKGRAIITATNGDLVARQMVSITKASSNAPKTNVSNLKVTIASKTYTGSYLKPSPVVRDGAMKLVKGTHYTVSYSNNLNAGRAKVTITGKGAYSGSVVKRFTIHKAALSRANVKLSSVKLAYTGAARRPAVTVRDIGRNSTKLLVRGVDYRLKNPGTRYGTATVTITATPACRNYTGTLTKTYTVQ